MGLGLPIKYSFIAKRFYRVNPSRSRDSGNTGLGLSIVKHILNRHNANFQIESEMGKGSNLLLLSIKEDRLSKDFFFSFFVFLCNLNCLPPNPVY